MSENLTYGIVIKIVVGGKITIKNLFVFMKSHEFLIHFLTSLRNVFCQMFNLDKVHVLHFKGTQQAVGSFKFKI